MDETNLRARLAFKQEEIDLILAIDRIRDTAPDPATMLVAIADALVEQFQADLCMICLRERETGELQLKAASDHQQRFGQLRVTRALAEQVLETDQVVVWQGERVKAALGLDQLWDDLQLAALPIVMRKDEHLGALLLARSGHPFDAQDIALLKTAESQVDSAVVQGYAFYDLQQRNKELETIYRVDRIRDQQLSFDEMLNTVLQEIQRVIQSEMGFIMLYNRQGQELEMRAATHDDLFQVVSYYEIVNHIARQALQRAEMVCDNNLGEVLHSVMCIPLILCEEIIGVLGVVNRYGPRGFGSADRRLLSAIGSQMDTAIFESIERRRLQQLLGRSVDPRVMERLLANPDVDFLKGERAVLSVLYADLRGSTRLAEHTDPEMLVAFVNGYLGRMTEVILAHQATLDKFVGDEVMALFGAPFPQSDHALRAVRVGLRMQEAHQEVMDQWAAQGIAPTPIGIGVATGELIVGEMGSPRRTDYTVIGRAANLGARLCSVARSGQVLISQQTYDMIADHVKAVPVRGLRLKGLGQELTAYHVTRIVGE